MKLRQSTFRLALGCLVGGLLVAALPHLFPPAPAAAQGCTFTLNPTSRNFAAGGGQGGVAVTASLPACAWPAVANVSWLTITAGATGTGNGAVAYAVALNPTNAPRNGTLTIAGQTFNVTQSANPTGLQFYPLPRPLRLLDTRPDQSLCDNVGTPITGGTALTTQARITCNGLTIPPTAQAIVGNVTAINQTASFGFLTLFPAGQPLPLAANMIYEPGQLLSNNFTVGLNANGEFSTFAERTLHVVIDVSGYFAPPTPTGLFYHALPRPLRLLDTRADQSLCDNVGLPITGGTALTTQARISCNGLTIPTAAQAIVGNATVINQTALFGFMTLFPSGQTLPLAANMIYAPNQLLANAFTVGLSAGGSFDTFAERTLHLVIDVAGYYSPEANDANGPGLLLNPLPRPLRLLDTRPDQSLCDNVGAPIAAGTSLTTLARVTCDGITIPNPAQAINGNITVINQTASFGFLTLFPAGQTLPLAANMIYAPGQLLSNAFTVGLSAMGEFNTFGERTIHVVIDVSGYFAPPPVNSAPTVDAGADQTVAPANAANLIGNATDDGLPNATLSLSWSQVSGPGTVTFGNANQAVTTASFSLTGVYVLRLTASDGVLNGQDDVTITVSGGGPLNVNAGADQVVTLPNTALLLGTVNGGAPPLGIAWSKVSGPGSVIFSNASATTTTAMFAQSGVYVLRLSATDTGGKVSDDVQVTVNADPTPPPPDPTLTAPPLNMTIATTIGTATEFLYSGPNPIQTGVAPGTINPMRAAVLKGRVLDKNNAPLSLVKISVLDHPEFGQTLSRADGRFDLAVNGGGVFHVKYERVGFLPLQRTEDVPWQDYCGVPDVVLMGYDANVTLVDLLAATPMQIAQSGVSTDASGTRRTALLFKSGTTATMKLPGGAMVGLDKLHVRATEFTVGANGPNAMPGELPANSAYTYAVEYSLDEAVAANAVETTFSQPVVQYNENFLNFPVGIDIPSGAYDRLTGQWVASASGRVVKILSLTAGTANLDVNGSGVPATDPQYAALGVNTAERQTLATLYAVNQTLWRVPIIHFSPWDSNWPYGPPPDAQPPGGGPPSSGDTPPDDPHEFDGSIIGVQGQTLGEELSLVGSPFKLRYSSDRKQGRVAARSINIPLSGATIPASLKRIELTVTVAGRTFTNSFPAQLNQSTVFTWDGLDAYGRTLQGKQPATVNVGYVYDGSYVRSERFGYNGNGTPITGDAARRELTLAQVSQRELGAFDNRALALGGWSLDVHHFYDPTDRVIYEGNGARRSVQTINATITTVAGNGGTGFGGDNVPAVSTPFFFPFSATVAPNGELYVADFLNKRIRKVDLNGIVTTVVGTGANCTPTLPCGDGGQAVNAQLASATDVAFGPDGSLYIADAQAFRTRKVAPGGIITTVVGTGQACADPVGGCGDGGPATQAQLSSSSISCCTANLTVAPDGALYLGDAGNHRLRRVGTDGIITTIAGNGRTAAQGGCTVVGSTPVIATNACVSEPFDVTALADGSVYFTDALLNQILRVTADGFIRVVAGDGVCGNTGDGGPALAARMCRPEGITRGLDGALYFSDWMNARIRRIDANGIITNYAATGAPGFSGDGGPATAAQIRQSIGVSLGPDGALYIGEANNHRIRKVFPPLPGFTNADLAVPSADGSELFKFNAAGRHLQTLNTLTGAVRYTFGYDSAGRLLTVTDGDNNVTTIQRNGAGAPTGILSPYNQLTTCTLDSNGYFATIINPAGEQHQFIYTSGGLITLKRDPRNQPTAFTYDALGRLTRDDDAAMGFQTLMRTETGADYTVTRNTALNQTVAFQVQQLANGDTQRTTTSNGLPEILLERQNGTTTLTTPDGVTTNETSGPDPRWRMQAPFVTNAATATPGGLTLTATLSRVVNLTNPSDPLSLLSLNDALNVNGRNYANNYTAATRTFVFNTPLARQTQTTIDVQGRIASRIFANLNAAAYSRDARGRLATATFGTGAEARAFTYGYNAGGFLASVTNPLTQVTGFSYNPAGRITQQTTPDTSVTGFGYDAAGNVTSITPPGRPAHTLAYNAVNQVLAYTPPAVPGTGATQYAYNLDQQLTTITRPDAATITFGYDAAGRLSTLTTPSGVYGHTYSAMTGNLTGITAPGGPTLAFTYDGSLPLSQTWSGVIAGGVNHTYNHFFRPATQSVNGASTINFTYDNDNLLTGAGGLTLTRHPQHGLITGTSLSNVTDTRGYNGFGEALSYSASFNAAPLYARTFTRDKLGRITQKVETIGGGAANTFDYGYDAAGRLQQVKLNTVTVSAYTYDDNGNRLTRTTPGGTVVGAYDAQDRLLSYGAATYAYTANGELSGKTVGAQTTNYTYDALGNLRSVTLPDATQIAYVIDGFNRRAGKRVNGVLVQGFLYQDTRQLIAELDGGNNLVSRFVYGADRITPDYVVKAGVTYRILTDHLGSVRLVVNTTTGAIAQRLDYDEFGVVTMDTAPGFQPFGFAGGWYDAQTKLVRFGARDYDAETGRWTVKDPMLFAGEGVNLYGYVQGDPINVIDPSGFGLKDLLNPTPGIANPINDLDNIQIATLPGIIQNLTQQVISIRERIKELLKCKQRNKLQELELQALQQLNRSLTDQIKSLKQHANNLARQYGQTLYPNPNAPITSTRP